MFTILGVRAELSLISLFMNKVIFYFFLKKK
jgi:hypothetical protein